MIAQCRATIERTRLQAIATVPLSREIGRMTERRWWVVFDTIWSHAIPTSMSSAVRITASKSLRPCRSCGPCGATGAVEPGGGVRHLLRC